MNSVRLFDIERFATKDGPGIRTVVFFKGCPLHCLWCHNPEGISKAIQLSFDSEECIGCQTCQGPLEALACGKLEKAGTCPSKALHLEGYDLEVEDVIQILLEDKAYYENSNGGITLSGGEVLSQVDAAEQVLKRCKEEGLHCAIETSLYAQQKDITRILPYLDYIMFDIKCISPVLHAQLTGCDNTMILKNAKYLANAGIPFIVRTPVVLGLNDTEIEKIAQFVSTLNPEFYELLSYNPFGVTKAKKLGMVQKTYETPTRQQMKNFAEMAMAFGLVVYIDGERQ